MTAPAPNEAAALREEVAGIIRSNVGEFLGGIEGIDDAANELIAGPLASLIAGRR